MARNRSVIRIFVRSSGIMKMALSLPMNQLPGTWIMWPGLSLAGPFVRSGVGGLRLARLHLVAHRLFRRGDDLRGPAPGRDLLAGRLREVVGLHGELLGQLAL